MSEIASEVRGALRHCGVIQRVLILLFCCAMVPFGPTMAETRDGQSAVITRDRLEAAKSMMKTVGMERRFQNVIRKIGKRFAAALAQKHPDAAKDINEVYAKVAGRFATRSADAVALIAPLYAERFTVDELNRIRAFYSSPLGLKFVAAQADLSKRSQNLGAVWGGRIGRQMQRAVLAELAKRGVKLSTGREK